MQETVDNNIKDRIKITFKPDGYRKYFDDDKEERNCYIVTVKFDGKQCSFAYGDSIADTMDNKKPIASDIYDSIIDDFNWTKEEYPEYVDFAKELGYGEDSIKGLETYERCLEQGKKLHNVFNVADIEKLREELDR